MEIEHWFEKTDQTERTLACIKGLRMFDPSLTKPNVTTQLVPQVVGKQKGSKATEFDNRSFNHKSQSSDFSNLNIANFQQLPNRASYVSINNLSTWSYRVNTRRTIADPQQPKSSLEHKATLVVTLARLACGKNFETFSNYFVHSLMNFVPTCGPCNKAKLASIRPNGPQKI